MARKLPPLETRFKKGQSGNPQGGRLHNPEYKKIKRLTQAELAEMMLWISSATRDEMEAVAKDPQTPILKLMIVNLYATATKTGNYKAFDILMSRMIGPVKQQIELSNPDGEAFKIQNASTKELEAELAALEAREKARHGQK